MPAAAGKSAVPKSNADVNRVDAFLRSRLLKLYRSTPELLAEIRHLLAPRHRSPHYSPLDDVIEVLCRGRHYTWVGIYLAVENTPARQLLGSGTDTHPGTALAETRSKILVSMKLAGREFGVLDVESNQGNAFGPEDRVLLENVAYAVARFLAGQGKYIARKARQMTLAKSS